MQLTFQDVADIARGAAFLGAGGGDRKSVV